MAPFYDSGGRFDNGARYDDVSPPPTRKKHMPKPRLNLAQLTYEQKLTQANEIKTSMTGNANFPTPVPTLAAYGTLITTATTKHAEWTDTQLLAKQKTVERQAAFDALDAASTQLAGYVEAASGGDAAKIESAGMSVRADSTAPVGPMPQVLDLVLSAGDFDGTLDAMWHPVRGAKSYEVQVSPDPPGTWTQKMASGKSSATIEGLTSGAKIWVRVRAVGADNKPGPWSDPAVKVVP